MSTTSSIYAEVWRNNQWEPIPAPKWIKGKQVPVAYMYPGTEYELYAALVGYYRPHLYHIYHTEEIALLSEPRGFPKDMNAIYKHHFEDSSMGGCWLISWFMVQEIVDYDWDRKFPTFVGYVKSQYASLFSASDSFPVAFPDDGHIDITKREGTTEVSWVESYRNFVGCVDWFIEELLKLGNPKEVRIIFWLE
jgi:hypothetical protein